MYAVQCVQGQTAAAILSKSLRAAVRTGQNPELETEHREIRDYLWQEMGKLGWKKEEEEEVAEKNDEVKEVRSSQRMRRTRKTMRSSLVDRTGRTVLQSSEEEEYSPEREILRERGKKNVKSGKGSAVSTHTGNADRHRNRKETPFKSCPLSASDSVSIARSSSSSSSSSSRHVKGFYNPLGQVKLPALIPEGGEGDEREREEGEEEEEGKGERCPVIDNWLVDDVGRQPPSKRRRGVVKDSLDTITSDRKQERARSRSVAVRVGQGSVGEVERRASVGGGGRRARVGGAASQRRLASTADHLCDDTVTLLDSDLEGGEEDMDFWSAACGEACREARSEGAQQFGSTVHPPHPPAHPSSHSHRHTVPHHTPSQAQSVLPLSSAPPHTPTRFTSTTVTTSTAPMPLRIRVKIEERSFLIPCPRSLGDGSQTPLSWLARQAAERYYTQQGIRPHLSLVTTDGDILCGGDAVCDVLVSGEEVRGVVEHWHTPPLHERYQTTTSNSGVGEEEGWDEVGSVVFIGDVLLSVWYWGCRVRFSGLCTTFSN